MKKIINHAITLWMIPFWTLILDCGFVSHKQHRAIRSAEVYNTAEYGFSQGIITDSPKTIYLSGIVGWNKKRGLPDPNRFETQTIQIFENLKLLLKSENATLDDVLRLEVFIVGIDTNKLKEYSKISAQFFNSGHKPASTVIGVEALSREGLLIEIQATASIR
ncbi:RidA family protein [Leptospira sp. 201903071]|uniref:RidA family protein n=1 Tax=Leptospira ainazelensis TaxID=2810034 RepID=UPI00196330C5|nr:RidA family protein [Leptospira ainazelensis]MBM9500900.1 RidA family protein [Leptospira ainazelensis]